MHNPEYLLDRLGKRAEKLRAQLSRVWRGDPTVLDSFDADLESLFGDLTSGDIYHAHAPAALNAIYYELLPGKDDGRDYDVNLPTAGTKPVPGHGRFYRLLRPGVWVAIDYRDSNAYRTAQSNRSLWLTYTLGARRQAS